MGDFLEAIQALPNLGMHELLIALGLVVIYGLYQLFNYLFKDGNCAVIMKKNKKIKSLKELKKHPFFHNVDYLINYKIPYIDLKEKGRTEIFRDFLRIKFTVYKESLNRFLDKEIKPSEFESEINNHFNEAIQEYINRCLGAGIPQIVVDKFQQWHMPRIEFTNMAIEQICKTEIIDNDIEKMFAILTIYDSALYATVIDAEQTLKKLNGELTGTIYKNICVGDIPH